MPKPDKQEKRPTDVNQLAHYLGNLSTKEPEIATTSVPPTVSIYMASIGQKGGRIGGKRRLKTMTKEQRRKIAVKAARARWNKSEGHRKES